MTDEREWPERDECALCGNKATAAVIDLHHIEPRSQAPDRVYDPENVVPLCRQCHDRVTMHELELERQGNVLLVRRAGEVRAVVPFRKLAVLPFRDEMLLDVPPVAVVDALPVASLEDLRGVFDRAAEVAETSRAWQAAVVYHLVMRAGFLDDPVREVAAFLGISTVACRRLYDEGRLLYGVLRTVYTDDAEWHQVVGALVHYPRLVDALAQHHLLQTDVRGHEEEAREMVNTLLDIVRVNPTEALRTLVEWEEEEATHGAGAMGVVLVERLEQRLEKLLRASLPQLRDMGLDWEEVGRRLHRLVDRILEAYRA